MTSFGQSRFALYFALVQLSEILVFAGRDSPELAQSDNGHPESSTLVTGTYQAAPDVGFDRFVMAPRAMFGADVAMVVERLLRQRPEPGDGAAITACELAGSVGRCCVGRRCRNPGTALCTLYCFCHTGPNTAVSSSYRKTRQVEAYLGVRESKTRPAWPERPVRPVFHGQRSIIRVQGRGVN